METRGTQGDRRTTLWHVRLAFWLTHLADRADLGDLQTTGMVLVVGRLLALVYEVSKTLFFHSVHPPPAITFNFCVGRR